MSAHLVQNHTGGQSQTGPTRARAGAFAALCGANIVHPSPARGRSRADARSCILFAFVFSSARVRDFLFAAGTNRNDDRLAAVSPITALDSRPPRPDSDRARFWALPAAAPFGGAPEHFPFAPPSETKIFDFISESNENRDWGAAAWPTADPGARDIAGKARTLPLPGDFPDTGPSPLFPAAIYAPPGHSAPIIFCDPDFIYCRRHEKSHFPGARGEQPFAAAMENGDAAIGEFLFGIALERAPDFDNSALLDVFPPVVSSCAACNGAPRRGLTSPR